MKKAQTQTRRILSIFLALLMIILAIPLSDAFDINIFPKTAALAASGICGDNVHWNFDKTTGGLTITGSGPMDDYPGGTSPFSMNEEIKSVNINGNVTSVGWCTFQYCSSLSSLRIGDSVTCIEVGAFENCASLTSISFGSGLKEIKQSAFESCKVLSSVSFGSGLESIGYAAFSDTALRIVTIPDSVTSIDSPAFGGSKLETINVNPENKNYSSSQGILYDKDKATLIQCPCAKTEVSIPSSVTSIGNGAFSGSALESISIPNNVQSIETGAFNGSALKTVSIPNSVTSVGWWAFSNCSALRSVTIGDGIKNISKGMFNECVALSSVTFGKNIERIDTGAFEYCTALQSITIPAGVKSIGDEAFADCISLSHVTIPKSVSNIIDEAFYHCTSLTNIVIPDSVTSIGERVFLECTSLTNATIGNGVQSIGWGAFNNCSSLKDVYYTGTKTQWEQIIVYDFNEPLLNAKLHFNDSSELHTHKQGTPVIENELLATESHKGSYDVVIYCEICGAELSRTTQTGDAFTKPTLPDEQANKHTLNIFQRIIQWLRNLLNRLFGR